MYSKSQLSYWNEADNTIVTWQKSCRVKATRNLGLIAGVLHFRQQIDKFLESRVVLSSLHQQVQRQKYNLQMRVSHSLYTPIQFQPGTEYERNWLLPLDGAYILSRTYERCCTVICSDYEQWIFVGRTCNVRPHRQIFSVNRQEQQLWS